MKAKPILIDAISIALIIACLAGVSIPFLKIPLSFLIVLMNAFMTENGFLKLGFKKWKNGFKNIGISLLLAITLSVVSYGLLLPYLSFLTGEAIDSSAFRSIEGNTHLLFIYLLIGWLIGGIAEEVIFRGFIFNRITQYLPGNLGQVVAIVASSAIFGYLHVYQGLTGQLLTGILGGVLVTIFILTKKNLWVPILTHGFINTISMILIFKGWLNI